MRFLKTLLVIVFFPITVFASSDAANLTGYFKFPSYADYWETSSDERWLITALSTPVDIELFNNPTESAYPALVAEDIYTLKLTHFTYAISPSIHVYGTHKSWLRVKTVDGQLLWMKEQGPGEFSSLDDLLQAEWFITPDTGHELHVQPNQDPLEMAIHNRDDGYYSLTLRGFESTADQLWLKLERRPDYMPLKMREETIIDSSTYTGWLKAHRDDGELAFKFDNPC